MCGLNMGGYFFSCRVWNFSEHSLLGKLGDCNISVWRWRFLQKDEYQPYCVQKMVHGISHYVCIIKWNITMRRSANMHFSYLLLADEALGHGYLPKKGKASLINLEFMHTQSSSYLTMTTLSDGALLDKKDTIFSLSLKLCMNILWI